MECLKFTLEGLNASSMDSVMKEMILGVIHPPTLNPDDLLLSKRASQLAGIEVLLESVMLSILPLLLSTCNEYPTDLSKLRLLSALASVKSSATFVDCLPKILPRIIDIGVLGLVVFDDENSSVDSSIFSIRFLSKSHKSLISLPLFQQQLVPSVIQREVFLASSKLFKRVPENSLKSIVDLLGVVLMNDALPMGDFSASGILKIQSRLSAAATSNIEENPVTAGAVRSPTSASKIYVSEVLAKTAGDSPTTFTLTLDDGRLVSRTSRMISAPPSNGAKSSVSDYGIRSVIETDFTNPLKRATILFLLNSFLQSSSQELLLDLIPCFLSLIVPMALCDPFTIVHENGFAALGTLSLIIKKFDRVGQISEV